MTLSSVAPGRGSAATDPSPSGAAQGSHYRAGRLGPLTRGLREAGLGLITFGVIVFLFVAYQLFGTNIAEAHSQSKLSKQFAASIAATQHSSGTSTGAPGGSSGSTPPKSSAPSQATQSSSTAQATATQTEAIPSAPTGNAIDHLVIPAIGVDKFVVEGTNESNLTEGPGHYPGTALPGQDGNAAIAGHRTTYGAPFFELGKLAPGDPIYITDLNDHTWLYKVDQPPQVVAPTDVAILDPTSFAQLTLTTCNPIYSATSRLVVFAKLVGNAVPVTAPQAVNIAELPSGRPSTQGSAAASATAAAASTPHVLSGPVAGFDAGGGGSSNAWFPALAYGVAVIGLWIATRVWINRTRRWSRLAAYVVGIAACLVPLWFCFENVTRLLPPSV